MSSGSAVKMALSHFESGLLREAGFEGLSREAGMAYVAMLLLLVVVVTLGLAFLLTVGTDVSATMTRGKGMQARYLAESAANHALWRLLNEPRFPESEDTYYMHSLGTGRYGYKVRRHTDTTFATVAAIGAVGESIVEQSYVIRIKSEIAEDVQMMAVYDKSSELRPRYRPFTNVAWAGEKDTVNVGDDQVNWLELQGCPLRTEMIMGTLDSANDINLAVWDGRKWGNHMEFTTNSSGDSKCFDIAYESISGDAVVLGRTGSGGVPSYTVWNGASWAHDPPVSAPSTKGTTMSIIVMEPNPTNDEILAGVLDTDFDIALMRWDGDSFQSLGEVESWCPTKELPMFDIAYEQSGEAMIVWARAFATSPRYCMWNGSSLGPKGYLPSFEMSPILVHAAGDPSSDYISVCAVDWNLNLNMAIWNGSSWVDSRELTIVVSNMERQGFDMEWEPTGQDLLVAWAHTLSPRVHYFKWTKGTPLSMGSVEYGPSFGTKLSTIDMLPIPGTEKIILAVCNETGELSCTLWDGDRFLDDPAVLLGADLSQPDRTSYDLAVAGK